MHHCGTHQILKRSKQHLQNLYQKQKHLSHTIWASRQSLSSICMALLYPPTWNYLSNLSKIFTKMMTKNKKTTHLKILSFKMVSCSFHCMELLQPPDLNNLNNMSKILTKILMKKNATQFDTLSALRQSLSLVYCSYVIGKLTLDKIS